MKLYTLFAIMLSSLFPLSAMEMEQETNLDTLPRELQYHIFSFIDKAKDLEAVSQVNHALKEEADTDLFWGSLYQQKKAENLKFIESCQPYLLPTNKGADDEFHIGYERLQSFYRDAKSIVANDTKPEERSWKEHYKTIFATREIPLSMDWATMNRNGLGVNVAFKITVDSIGSHYDFYQNKQDEPQPKIRLTRNILSQEITLSYQKIRGHYGEAIYDNAKHFIAPLAPEMLFLPTTLGSVIAMTVSWDKDHPSYFKGNIHYIIQLANGSVVEATYLKSKGEQATYQLKDADGKAFKKIKLSTQTYQLVDKKKCTIS